MPIGGTRETKTVGNSYRKSPIHEYAKAFTECAQTILREDGYDIFEEPQKVMRRRASNEAMRHFFTEGIFDTNNALYDAYDQQDLQERLVILEHEEE